MFDIYTHPDNYDFAWVCECCEAESDPQRTTRRTAFKDAVAHAHECLTDLRTRQGTDVWPIEYEPADFIHELMNVTATARATFKTGYWCIANKKP